ncbi:transaldolase family protein, partial [Arsenicicoccus bolidensis]|nr:transaldolase family protein [Arsenicicoccus bolidensis]
MACTSTTTPPAGGAGWATSRTCSGPASSSITTARTLAPLDCPRLARSAAKLADQAEYFNGLADNIIVKIPATRRGIEAI